MKIISVKNRLSHLQENKLFQLLLFLSKTVISKAGTYFYYNSQLIMKLIWVIPHFLLVPSILQFFTYTTIQQN